MNDKELDEILTLLENGMWNKDVREGMFGRSMTRAEAKQAILDWHTRKLNEAVLTELNQAREWCAGGQNCEYGKLVDRIAELTKESTDE